MAGKRTFAQRWLKSWTFRSGHWTGVGTGVPFTPVIHWHAILGPPGRGVLSGDSLLTEDGYLLLDEEGLPLYYEYTTITVDDYRWTVLTGSDRRYKAIKGAD